MIVRRRPPNWREKAQEAATGREDNQTIATGHEKSLQPQAMRRLGMRPPGGTNETARGYT